MNAKETKALLKAAKLIKKSGKALGDILNEKEIIHTNDTGDKFYEADNDLEVYYVSNVGGDVNLWINRLKDLDLKEQKDSTDIYRTEEEALLAGLKKWRPEITDIDRTTPEGLKDKKDLILEVISGKEIQVKGILSGGWGIRERYVFNSPLDSYRIKPEEPQKETRPFQTDKVKIEWTIEGSKLSIQVLEMDERFRRKDASEYIIRFESEAGFNVESIAVLDLCTGSSLCLRGRLRGDDDLVEHYTFPTSQELKDYITKAEEALKEWSEKWEGFRELAYENSLGEKFYSGDYTIFFFINKESGRDIQIDNAIGCSKPLIENSTYTEASLTKSGAYQIYSNWLKEQGE